MDSPFQHNRLPKLDSWGRHKSVTDHSLFHGLFTFDIPQSLWKIVENGTEVTSSVNATSSNGMLKMDSTGLSSLEVSSYRHPRYQPNRGILYSASWILPDWQSDATVDFGLFNDTESGFFFRVRSGRVYAVRLTLSTEYEEEINLPQGADLSKGCLYDIQCQWRGVGSFFFYITYNLGTTVHTMNLLGTLSAISVNNPALHVAQRIIPNTNDAVAYCGCLDYTTEGGENERLVYANVPVIDGVVSEGDGLIAIRIPTTINGNHYSRDAKIGRIYVHADKKSDFEMYVSRDASSVTATGWTAVNSGSFIESADSITAVDATKGRLVSTFAIQAGGSDSRANPIPEQIDFYLTAKDIMFLKCTSGASVTASALIELGEEI